LLALQREFVAGRPRKHYRALVAGRWPAAGVSHLRFPLARAQTRDGDRRVRVAADGMAADTQVTVLAHIAGNPALGQPAWFSLLDCRLLTGRTHQIRVHLAHTGHPIIGDPKYGDFHSNKRIHSQGFNRMFLHAISLTINHPLDGRPRHFEAPLPAAFRAKCGSDSVRPAGAIVAGPGPIDSSTEFTS